MDITDDELPYWLALLRAPGIGPIKYNAILQQFDTLAEMFNEPAYFRNLPGLPHELMSYLANPPWAQIESDIKTLASYCAHVVTIREPDYPMLLKETVSAPPILFIRGQKEVINKHQIAIVGSRNPTIHGRELAKKFATELTHHGLVITSGLALGIDAVSHESCIHAKGQTIAVIGTGIDIIYPRQHHDMAIEISQQGAIVSEFPPGTLPLPDHFPRRNRVISGLSLGTLVVEAALRSGSLVTARHAIEQGREVFAVPGSVHNPLARGCHQLLRNGAKLVESITDIIEELDPGGRIFDQKAMPKITEKIKNVAAGLAKEYAMLLECLGFEIMPIDNIIACTGIPADKVTVLLVELELLGLVNAVPGGYSRVC